MTSIIANVPSPLATATGTGSQQTVSQTVGGLPVGQYYYRIVTETTDGSGNPRILYGDPMPFTIVGGVAAVASQPAINVDNPPKSATLNGYVLLPPGQQASYAYEYGQDPVLAGPTTIVPSTPLSITGTEEPQFTEPRVVSNLAPGTYYQRIVATITDGQGNVNKAYGSILPFTITGQPTTMVTGDAIKTDSKSPYPSHPFKGLGVPFTY